MHFLVVVSSKSGSTKSTQDSWDADELSGSTKSTQDLWDADELSGSSKSTQDSWDADDPEELLELSSELESSQVEHGESKLSICVLFCVKHPENWHALHFA